MDQLEPSKPTSSFDELSKVLSAYDKADLIHVIQELMHIKEAELDLPFKTDVSSQESALIPMAWSYYFEIMGLTEIKNHLQFIMKLNTSISGKRASLIVEALANKATMISKTESNVRK